MKPTFRKRTILPPGSWSVGAFAIAVLILAACLLWLFSDRSPGPRTSVREYNALPRSFDGDSRELAQTEIVPTLDTPLTPGKNAIYCASFVAAWKALQELAEEPVSLLGAEEPCRRLNSALDPGEYLSPSAYYAAAGFVPDGILERIRTELATRFPQKAPPTFPGIVPNSFVAYSYLSARVLFSIPFCDNPDPLTFTGSDDAPTQVHAFGLSRECAAANPELPRQVEVLYLEDRSRSFSEPAFAIDLCRHSQPNQLIVARIDQANTLAETLSDLESGMHRFAEQGNRRCFSSQDRFLVPNIFWHIEHYFADLEGHEFTNAALSGHRMDVALQEIEFRLDRCGAEVKSEAKMHMLSIPLHLQADGPFLILIRQRGALEPFFVMWVENAELLQKCPG